MATQAKISRLIEKGEYAQAAEVTAKNTKVLSASTAALFQAYAAGGLLLQGDRAAATKVLGEVDPLIANAPDHESRVIGMMVKAFRGEKSADAVIRETRESNAMRHGVFAAAVQAALTNDRARAGAHLARATREASDLEFPYLEVKAMASRVN